MSKVLYIISWNLLLRSEGYLLYHETDYMKELRIGEDIMKIALTFGWSGARLDQLGFSAFRWGGRKWHTNSVNVLGFTSNKFYDVGSSVRNCVSPWFRWEYKSMGLNGGEYGMKLVTV